MKQHTIHLHVAKNLESPLTPKKSVPTQSILLLANDFEALCFLLRTHLGTLQGFSVLVEDVAPQNNGLSVLGVNNPQRRPEWLSLTMEFRDTRFRVADYTLQRDLLGSLSRLACPGMKVFLKGAIRLPDEFSVERMNNMMGPDLVSSEALVWYTIDTMREGKRLADVTALSGEHEVAIRFYRAMNDQHKDWARDGVRSIHLVAGNLLFVLSLDVLISMAYLQLKLGYMDALADLCDYLRSLIDPLTCLSMGRSDSMIMKQVASQVRHIVVLAELFVTDFSKANGIIFGPRVLGMGFHEFTSDSAKTVREVIELFSEHPDEPYHQHDLQVLEAVANKEDLASSHLSLEQCSAYKLAPTVFNFHQGQGVPQKPDHIHGLRNMNTLRQLDAGTKKKINELQQKYGAQVTQWD